MTKESEKKLINKIEKMQTVLANKKSVRTVVAQTPPPIRKV